MNFSLASIKSSLISRRKHARYSFNRPANWDFYTESGGSKAGFIENISQGGFLLCSAELVDHRRWLRVMFREPKNNVWFTLIGRVVRREDRMESWQDDQITLYRYGVELVHPINALVIDQLQNENFTCATCGDLTDEFDLDECATCGLRKACHNLTAPNGSSDDENDTVA